MTLQFLHVSKAFASLSVLQDFSFSFEAGNSYCLMGPSGCGKSTLLRLACGLLQPDSGYITGTENHFSYVFQENRLLPWYTARQNIELVCRRRSADYWLDAVGLKAFADALPETLSGGMRRRIALARALAADGHIYLFDEPFTGLDTERREEIIALIHQYTTEHLCLYTSHDPLEAEKVADQVLNFSGPPLQFLF
mgnify:FL=1